MPPILYTVHESVAVMTLNRPDALNALDPSMIDILLEYSAQAARDKAVRAVIVRGAGGHFMAGGDLKWFMEQTAQPEDKRRACFETLIGRVHDAVLNFRTMEKPVIASVQGAVAGFGLSLMMACDLAIAADSAYFSLAYGRLGLSPDGGATWSLPRQTGYKRAMEIALLGDRFDARQACAWGLVNWVVPAADLEAQTQALAQRLAAGPARAMRHTKALLSRAFDNTLTAQLRAEQDCFADCTIDADFAEGLSAFFGKRPPVFGG